jgi:hypothetical protein
MQHTCAYLRARPTGLCVRLVSKVLKDDNLLRLLFVKKRKKFLHFFLSFFPFPQFQQPCFSASGDKARLIAQYLRSPEDTIFAPILGPYHGDY